eukprot:scaffold27196_cov111-Isochrysis_galbana.AAC.1
MLPWRARMADRSMMLYSRTKGARGSSGPPGSRRNWKEYSLCLRITWHVESESIRNASEKASGTLYFRGSVSLSSPGWSAAPEPKTMEWYSCAALRLRWSGSSLCSPNLSEVAMHTSPDKR